MVSLVHMFGLFLLGNFVCGIIANQERDKGHGAPKVTEKSVSRAGYLFTISLFHQLSSDNEGKNLFYSPYSISSALSMTMLGTKGKSESEIIEAMGYQFCDDCAEDIHIKSGEVREKIKKSSGVTLKVSNRLFPGKSFQIKEDFQYRSRKYYGTSVTQLDFSRNPDNSRRFINFWVSHETNNKINELLLPGTITSATKLVLANAIYFKGTWDSKFDPAKTSRKSFHVDYETIAEVDMMKQKAKFRYATNNLFSVVELPYAKKETSMIIVLPSDRLDLYRLERSFKAGVLEYFGTYGTLQEVTVSLPKFKIEFETDLVETLRNLGVESIFGREANFQKLSDVTELYISSIAHKAVIEVNEEGTEAAAATAAILQRRMLSFPKTFTCDRPFFFFLRHNPTNTVLFAGRYVDPRQ